MSFSGNHETRIAPPKATETRAKSSIVSDYGGYGPSQDYDQYDYDKITYMVDSR